MLRAVFEYDIYLPTADEQGRPFPAELLTEYRSALTHIFGTLTEFRHRGEGTWHICGIRFHGEVALYRGLAESQLQSREALRAFQLRVQREMHQKHLLIIERAVTAL